MYTRFRQTMIKLFLVFSVIMLALADDNHFEKSLVQLIKDAGHTVEVHKVLTEDNYILTVFRLPSKLRNPKVVLLMHGILGSGADYVIGGNGDSLAYLLVENGYDVWLGNARGNVFSQAHKTLSVESHQFWKFSFHEIGVYDLPAMIDYALDRTNATTLDYCGYSQGTTVFFVLLAMKPEYNSKLTTAHLMAPVAFMRFPQSISKSLNSRQSEFRNFLLTYRLYEIIPISSETRKMIANYCDKRIGGLTTCKSNYMLIGGETRSQYNEDLLPKIFKYFPASSGYRQFLHYGHIINHDGRFVRFDHQKRKNLELYGQPVPPQYNLSNIRTNLHFLYGSGDTVANPKDVHHLMTKLKAFATGITKINDWNHLDFLYGKDLERKVNKVILQKMKSRE